MSAGTVPELEPIGVLGGPETLPDVRTLDIPPRLRELAHRFESLCANAVDPLEVAAGLEADGLSDQAVKARYGCPDVFALAEELFRLVPRAPAEPAPLPEVWAANPKLHLLRGVLFALPGLGYTAATPLLVRPAALAVLVGSLVLSWTMSQGLSYLGYVRLGLGRADAAYSVLRNGLFFCGTLVALASAGLAWFSDAGWSVLALGVGQGIYLLAATVLLVRGAELLLLLALAPAVLAGGLHLLGGHRFLPHWAELLGLIGSVLLTVGFAVWRTRTGKPVRAKARPNWTELRNALPHALFGLCAAGLLALPVVWAVLPSAPDIPGAALAALPVSLSMGFAEWCLFGYRRRMGRLLRESTTLASFALRSRFVLTGVLTRYLIAAAALCAVVLFTVPGAIPAAVPTYAAYLALGGALFLALLVQALGLNTIALIACGAALAVEVAFTLTGGALRWPLGTVWVQLAVGLALLLVLYCHAALSLGSAVRHR
ncbi:hypothetical protein [Crossiella cryophila]|uniref:Uncharacterized protein n=1 Tax=Crossiella cryophila TaxID=43355 RepID=A0A7W7C9K1_9PSEU|nr:hypothetical protein [Crossiella cryophila]MBB4677068.1 hypothetical protein [Crossiella cryophila]